MFIIPRIERIVFALIGTLLLLSSFSTGCGVGTDAPPHKPDIPEIHVIPPPSQWSVSLDSVTVTDWTTYVESRNTEGYKLLDVGDSAAWLKEDGRDISISTHSNQYPFRPVIKLTRTYTGSTGVRVDKVLVINDDEGKPRVFLNF